MAYPHALKNMDGMETAPISIGRARKRKGSMKVKKTALK